MIEDIAALIPAYNPDKEMIKVVGELVSEFSNIVIVDDGCDESYGKIFSEVERLGERSSITILHHEVNKGKGAALKTGFSYILESLPGVSAVVTLDADGQHTVSDTLKCCKGFEDFEGKTKPVVFGCRDFKSDTKIPARSRFGNRLTSRLLKLFGNITLSDTQTGLRVFGRDILADLCAVPGERYEFEMNMIFELHDMGVPFMEVPIEVIYLNENESSHFNPIKDSIRIYKVFFKFIASSLGSFVVDYALFSALVCLLANRMPEVSIGLLNLSIDYIVVSTVIARICSGIFNYCINRMIFKTRKKDAAGSGPRYFILWLAQMLISANAVKYLTLWLGIPAMVTKIIVDPILFFISYKVQQVWVFKKKDE
ncbi:MAG: bifunctional glycosyltransferase family 2/GtrA family protein [Lachnospiraceae bacterium]|nr:bifunctional glycosyltransferase family 2/GtrA family protein [Lachnospiraceae bacterium]